LYIFDKRPRKVNNIAFLSKAKKASGRNDMDSNNCRVCHCLFKTKFGNFTEDQQGYMSTENLFKPSNRKDCRSVVPANILESVGISLDRSETYSHRVRLWQKNPQFGQSDALIHEESRKPEENPSREAEKVPAKSKDAGKRLFCEHTPDQNSTEISKREVSTCLPPFSFIRDFGKQNTRGNVSKI